MPSTHPHHTRPEAGTKALTAQQGDSTPSTPRGGTNESGHSGMINHYRRQESQLQTSKLLLWLEMTLAHWSSHIQIKTGAGIEPRQWSSAQHSLCKCLRLHEINSPPKTPYLVVMPPRVKIKDYPKEWTGEIGWSHTAICYRGSNPCPEGHTPLQEFLCYSDLLPSNIHIPGFSSRLFSTLNMHIIETTSSLPYPHHPPFLPGNIIQSLLLSFSHSQLCTPLEIWALSKYLLKPDVEINQVNAIQYQLKL